MKVLTITCHNVYNHGASLQQFALIHYVESLGHTVETINYQPAYLADNYRYLGVPSKKFQKNIILKTLYIIAKFPTRFSTRKRRMAFNEFDEKYIPRTKQLYKDNQSLKNNIPLADVYICGSDQIWNTLFENGADPAFYLDFVPAGKRKISYAASFATSRIENGLEDFVKRKVENLDFVSVRESSAVTILMDLGIKEVTHVVDPVFLLSAEDWIEKFDLKKTEAQSYVLVYDFENNPLVKEYALHLKKTRDYQIVALNKIIDYADQIHWDIGPVEFLGLMRNASFVLANSFHATAFSFIFKKQFLVFNRSAGINTRMKDFLTEFGLKHRLVVSFDHQVVEDSIDFSVIEEPLNQRIEISKKYLQNAVKN